MFRIFCCLTNDGEIESRDGNEDDITSAMRQRLQLAICRLRTKASRVIKTIFRRDPQNLQCN